MSWPREHFYHGAWNMKITTAIKQQLCESRVTAGKYAKDSGRWETDPERREREAGCEKVNSREEEGKRGKHEITFMERPHYVTL